MSGEVAGGEVVNETVYKADSEKFGVVVFFAVAYFFGMEFFVTVFFFFIQRQVP